MKTHRAISTVLLALAFWLAHIGAIAAEPRIEGSAQYSNQVHHALLLLAARDTNAYAIVTNYIGLIKESERSGMAAYLKPPTYEMSDKTAFYSVSWCAATIAHDSFHSKFYHDYKKAHGKVPDNIWIGKAAEQQCMKHQLAVMEHIGASQWEMDWAKKQADGNYVQDSDSWKDYYKRNW